MLLKWVINIRAVCPTFVKAEYSIKTQHALPGTPAPRSDPQLPVLNYATGAGWHSWGRVRSLAAARRVIAANLPDSSRALLKYGFKVIVARRTALQLELNGGPDGFVWSMGK